MREENWRRSLRVWELRHCSPLSALLSWVFWRDVKEGKRSRSCRGMGVWGHSGYHTLKEHCVIKMGKHLTKYCLQGTS